MTLLFTYGSLKQGFQNEHINTGVRIDGVFRTRDRLPMYLLGDGHVPCIVHAPGDGHQIIGEVYRVDEACMAQIDRLERIDEPGGYLRITIDLERHDLALTSALSAFVYVKLPEQVPANTPRVGPLVEYTREHTQRFRW